MVLETLKALKAPFPWFGGKSRVARQVWERFGDVPNFVEPFFGSGAVLLGRPHEARIETVNDRDCYVSNFWRSIQRDPETVARWADWPVNEADLHARHRWLVAQTEFSERMLNDPDYCEPKIAGWWVWGICQWIGSGWCTQPEWTGRVAMGSPRGISTIDGQPRPALSGGGQGVHRRRLDATAEQEWRPHLSAPMGINGQRVRDLSFSAGWNKRPNLKRGGLGVHRTSLQIPMLSGDSGASGRGIHASALHRKFPKADRGTDSRFQGDAVYEWFAALSQRLRRVRVVCGDWKRVLGPSPTYHIGVTGVFLDPPYGVEAGRDNALYAHDGLDIASEVRAWALANGPHPKLRIALCGYEGEHDDLRAAGWRVLAWKAAGGYGVKSNGRGRFNAKRERIWFSPNCLRAEGPLFKVAEA